MYGVGAWQSAPVQNRRRFGVPPGGPWDSEASAYVRAICGLGRGAAVFELLQASCEVEIDHDGALAIVGSDVRVNGEAFCGIRPVSRGDRLSVAAHCAYLAHVQSQFAEAKPGWPLHEPRQIRYLPELFHDPIACRTSLAFSRSGVRFEPDISLPCDERPSEPSCVGAIQSTPSGQMIVIGPDGPTIGGYSRLGTVICADLDLIPRLKSGQQVDFVPVNYEVALELARRRQELVESRCAYLMSSGTAGLG